MKGVVMSKRRKFTPEYRREAAKLVIETGRSIVEVSREIGVGEQLLGRWVRLERERESGEPAGELDVDERAELKELRRQVHELRKDNEFLGKAAAFFAAKQQPRNGLS